MSKQGLIPEIKENALFVADAHYPHHNSILLKVLQNIKNSKIHTPQLILMGDIFDLLFGHNKYIQTFSQEAIALLKELSQTLEIIYLEGNHDFCLKEVFPNIKVYSREEQPIHYKLNNQDVFLSHGDKYETSLGYNTYCKLIRNKTLLTLLRPLEKKIIDHRMEKLKVKKICGDFKDYKKRFDAIRSHYPKDSIIIEGHFHQSLVHENYVSLPSLACQGKIGIVRNGEIVFIKV